MRRFSAKYICAPGTRGPGRGTVENAVENAFPTTLHGWMDGHGRGPHHGDRLGGNWFGLGGVAATSWCCCQGIVGDIWWRREVKTRRKVWQRLELRVREAGRLAGGVKQGFMGGRGTGIWLLVCWSGQGVEFLGCRCWSGGGRLPLHLLSVLSQRVRLKKSM